jgi:hypothetical protein
MLVIRDSLLGVGDPVSPDRLLEVREVILEKGNLLSYP